MVDNYVMPFNMLMASAIPERLKWSDHEKHNSLAFFDVAVIRLRTFDFVILLVLFLEDFAPISLDCALFLKSKISLRIRATLYC